MTKTTIKELIQDLCHDLADDTAIGVYYDDVVQHLCKTAHSPFAASSTVSITSGVSDYAFPSGAIRILGLFYKDTHLTFATVQELEAYDDVWRALAGPPLAFTIEDISARNYTLIPKPDATGVDGTIIYTQKRDTDIEDWVAFFIAFMVLREEFARPSNHQDAKFAEACGTVSELLFKVAGF